MNELVFIGLHCQAIDLAFDLRVQVSCLIVVPLVVAYFLRTRPSFCHQVLVENVLGDVLDSKRPRVTRLRLGRPSLVGLFSIMMALFVSTSTITLSGASAQDEPSGKAFRFSGSVTDEKGSPVKAEIYLIGVGDWMQGGIIRLGDSAKNGQFEFSYVESEPGELQGATLLARAEGYGPDWKPLSRYEARPFRLVKDAVAVRGRILDSEGEPLAGVQVTVRRIKAMNNSELSAYIKAVKAGDAFRFVFDKQVSITQMFNAETNMNGEFQLDGIGKNRVVDLKIAGPGIASEFVHVMTSDSPRVATEAKDRPWAFMEIHGSQFEFSANPSKPIRGVVVDAITKLPIPNAKVDCTILQKHEHNRFYDRAEATTGPSGEFELKGVARAGRYVIHAAPQNQTHLKGMTFLGEATDTVAKIKLHKGTTVRGTVVDSNTGKPVAASVKYFPVYPNDKITKEQDLGFRMDAWSEVTTDANGEFSIPVYAGAGCIAVQAKIRNKYGRAVVDAVEFFKGKIDYSAGAKLMSTGMPEDQFIYAGSKAGRPIPLMKQNYQAIELMMIDLEKAADERLEFKLKPVPVVQGQLVGLDGKPLSNVKFYSTLLGTSLPTDLKDGIFKVEGVGIDEKRDVLFMHDEKKLVAFHTLEQTKDPNQRKPLTVKAQRWGEVKGRLLDEFGEPLRNQAIRSEPRDVDSENAGRLCESFQTDEEGMFRVVGLVPGREYRLVATNHRPFVTPGVTTSPEIIVTLKPGEVLDKGDVLPQPLILTPPVPGRKR
ncbi:MAG: carboxypeptidase-like regulatory domain-containing protein [Mariniblastus sp.]